MEWSLSARWMTCLGFRKRYGHVAKVVQSRMANYFQNSPPLVFSYRLSFSRTAEISRLELEFEECLPRKTASIFKEGIGQESNEAYICKKLKNEAANQEKQIFLLCQISSSASSTLAILVFSLPFVARAPRAFALNRWGKALVHNFLHMSGWKCFGGLPPGFWTHS